MKLPPASTWRFRSWRRTFGSNMTETCTLGFARSWLACLSRYASSSSFEISTLVLIRSFSNSSRISCSRYRNVFSADLVRLIKPLLARLLHQQLAHDQFIEEPAFSALFRTGRGWPATVLPQRMSNSAWVMERPLIMAITGSSCGGSVQPVNEPSAYNANAAPVSPTCQCE